MQMNQYRKIATPEPALSSEILPLPLPLPLRYPLLSQGQGQNDTK
jgi:hypothetical protein